MNAADPKVVRSLQQASMLELFALSTLIDRLMADPARMAQIRLRLHLGQAVRFLDWREPRMPLRAARVLALAKDHVKVLEDGANRQWKLPYAAIEPRTDRADGDGGAPASAPTVTPAVAADAASPSIPTPQTQRDNFHRGDQVVFEDQLLQPHFGTIARINRQTATVHTDDGKTWRVSFALLRRLVEV
jgi:hypothetical protein